MTYRECGILWARTVFASLNTVAPLLFLVAVQREPPMEPDVGLGLPLDDGYHFRSCAGLQNTRGLARTCHLTLSLSSFIRDSALVHEGEHLLFFGEDIHSAGLETFSWRCPSCHFSEMPVITASSAVSCHFLLCNKCESMYFQPLASHKSPKLAGVGWSTERRRSAVG